MYCSCDYYVMYAVVRFPFNFNGIIKVKCAISALIQTTGCKLIGIPLPPHVLLEYATANVAELATKLLHKQ